MIALKTEAEIEVVAENAQLLAGILVDVALAVQPGIETLELDRLAEGRIRAAGAEPAFKGYHGYPATLCVSVNEEIVHGIPSARRLREGDIVSLDLGLKRAGYYADAAVTVGVGQIAPEAERLLEVTRDALRDAIRAARLGGYVSDLSHAIGRYVSGHGFTWCGSSWGMALAVISMRTRRFRVLGIRARGWPCGRGWFSVRNRW